MIGKRHQHGHQFKKDTGVWKMKRAVKQEAGEQNERKGGRFVSLCGKVRVNPSSN